MEEDIKRVPNFTKSEKSHLINIIVNNYKDVLEDKKTDRASLNLKLQAWKDIEREFNSTSPLSILRKAESLKRFYENRKKEIRRQAAEEKRQRFLTGGGPLPNIKMDDADELLKAILNKKTIYGIQSEFDSDSVPGQRELDNNDSVCLEFTLQQDEVDLVMEVNEQDITLPSTSYGKSPLQEQNRMTVIDSNNSLSENICTTPTGGNDKKRKLDNSNHGWKTYTPADLRTPLHPPLKTGENVKSSTSRRRPTKQIRALSSSDISVKYNQLLDKRLALVDFQVTQIKEERAFQKEERELKIKLLKLEVAHKEALLKQLNNYR